MHHDDDESEVNDLNVVYVLVSFVWSVLTKSSNNHPYLNQYLFAFKNLLSKFNLLNSQAELQELEPHFAFTTKGVTGSIAALPFLISTYWLHIVRNPIF